MSMMSLYPQYMKVRRTQKARESLTCYRFNMRKISRKWMLRQALKEELRKQEGQHYAENIEETMSTLKN